MKTVVGLAWLVYLSARLVYTCIDVHAESMARLR